MKIKDHLQKIIAASSQREGIIEKFLMNRCNYAIPDDERDLVYWKLLCYEIMYLWNLLGTCSTATLEMIIVDCKSVEKLSEPILGLSHFLMGSCYAILHDFENSISSYKQCIDLCNENQFNLHLAYVPAYACYELAVVLMKSPEDDSKDEAQKLLQHAQTYRNYDFEHRLKLKLFNFKSC